MSPNPPRHHHERLRDGIASDPEGSCTHLLLGALRGHGDAPDCVCPVVLLWVSQMLVRAATTRAFDAIVERWAVRLVGSRGRTDGREARRAAWLVARATDEWPTRASVAAIVALEGVGVECERVRSACSDALSFSPCPRTSEEVNAPETFERYDAFGRADSSINDAARDVPGGADARVVLTAVHAACAMRRAASLPLLVLSTNNGFMALEALSVASSVGRALSAGDDREFIAHVTGELLDVE